jgi:carboxypeptidase family protein
MKTSALAVLLLVMLAFAASAQETGGMGTLAGVVLDAQRKPVSGATVTMQSATGGNPRATKTNSQGRFFFPELVHGYYDVRATHNGLLSEWKHIIEVNVGKQTDVELQLKPTQKGPP